MILLCGIPSEPPLRLVMQAAAALGVPYVLLNQRESQHTDLCISVRGRNVTGVLGLAGVDWPLEAFSGIYVRLMDPRELPENRLAGPRPEEHARLERSYLLHEMFAVWLELAPGRIMNRPSAMASNVSKPYQAQCIVRAGFATPPTLITNSPAAVRRFQAEHGRLIYKSISSVRSIVQELVGPSLLGLERVRHLPTQFQAYIPGVNVRVHVAGDDLCATEIRTEAVDYRYAGRGQEGAGVEMAPVELPPAIAAKCLALSRQLQLPLCGIDLKRTPAGEYYCFEVNPAPGFSFYQERTGQDVAGAIVRYLAGK